MLTPVAVASARTVDPRSSSSASSPKSTCIPGRPETADGGRVAPNARRLLDPGDVSVVEANEAVAVAVDEVHAGLGKLRAEVGADERREDQRARVVPVFRDQRFAALATEVALPEIDFELELPGRGGQYDAAGARSYGTHERERPQPRRVGSELLRIGCSFERHVT